MKRLIFVIFVIFVGFVKLLSAAEKRPNIVFVLVDDQRNTSLGCAGHQQIKTPVIDSLSENGVRFENSFVNCAICMASRATLFTGLTSTSHGYYGGRGTSSPVIRQDVQTSFPVLLRNAGYRTGFFGKQHVRFQAGTNGMDMMFDKHETLSRNPYLKKMPDGSLRHVDEIMGDKSIEFLKTQPKDKPFFLYMSFNISHAEDGDRRPGYHFQWPLKETGMFDDIEPLRPNLDDPKYFKAAPVFLQDSMNYDRYLWRWDTPEKYRINMRAYYRMLAGMDRIVGRMRDTLKEMDVQDNTVIIYSADNGYYMGDRGFAGKWSHYEQSLRVPLIVYDPRMKSSLRGRGLNQMAVNLDIPATILDLANLRVPDKYQGVSLIPLLEDREPDSWRSNIYCEHHMNNARIPKWIGVRNDRYKYANYYEEKVELLYDLQMDPTELKNVAGDVSYKKILEQLRRTCQAYQEQYTRQPVVEYKKQLSQEESKSKRKS